MYVTDRTTFSPDVTLSVPSYRIEAFDGKLLHLSPEPESIPVDLSGLDAHAVAQATAIQPEGWELRGLIALDSGLFTTVMKQARTEGNVQRLGTVLEDAWYWLSPIDVRFVAQRNQSVVVGLFR
ncbi:hypothetical protein [Deinococcus sp. QL22]|uniref:hypothetical protein n=1 Tax=Deinococcus sp. QL22 TaxID=2939437 RepID=UPI002016AE74|nr:hypothetical protein [Deinococcus sp. QL22]UQN10676.1 hypothetical protein M1R55_30335 [Deinococcus sp. QL22]